MQTSPVKTVVRVAEMAGKLAVVISLTSYVAESGQRTKLKQFQAWQVLDLAKSGDGGRRLALRDLIDDQVPLTGIDLSNVTLNAFDFRSAHLQRASFRFADLREANFSCKLSFASRLTSAHPCANPLDERRTDLRNADFTGAKLEKADFSESDMDNSTIGEVDLRRGPGLQGHVRFERATMGRLANVAFYEANASRVMVLAQTWRNVEFTAVDFRYALFASVKLEGVSFKPMFAPPPDNRLLKSTTLEGVDFEDVTMDGHSLTADDLKDAYLCHTKINNREINRDCPPRL